MEKISAIENQIILETRLVLAKSFQNKSLWAKYVQEKLLTELELTKLIKVPVFIYG